MVKMRWIIWGAIFPAILSAQVTTYEGDMLPTDAGWTLEQAWCECPPIACEGNQWIEDGQLVQENGICEEIVGANFTTHERVLDDLEGVESWFAEWRVLTNGISEEFPWVAPALLVIFDGRVVVYHFTIADDQVAFLRDLSRPSMYFDISPDEPHTYRVELTGDDLGEQYSLYVDGEEMDAGVPVGPLFNPATGDAKIIFRSKSILVPHVTSWDYIRFGVRPADGTGDFTGDGEIGPADLPFFQECLETESGNWIGCAWADLDLLDGDVDCADAAAFVAAWTDPGEPPVFAECSDCPPDIDGSGGVNAVDLALLLGAWGSNPGHPADLTGDGLVNAADLAQLLGAWGACA